MSAFRRTLWHLESENRPTLTDTGPDGVRSTSTIVSEQFAMPAAVRWKGVADLITNGLSQLPSSAVISMIVAAVLAAVFEVARIRTKGRWQARKTPAPGTRAHAIWIEGYESICAGLISGAALVGIGNAIVNVLIS